MPVIQFPQNPKHQDVKTNLQQLHELAQRGEILGIYWIAHTKDGKHRAGMAGSYRGEPDMSVIVAGNALQKLHVYAARKRLEPMTVSHVM